MQQNEKQAGKSDRGEVRSEEGEAGNDSRLTYEIIGAAMKVHRALGPGFTESTYHSAFAKELMLRGIPFESERLFEVFYEGYLCGQYRADMVISEEVVVELKAVSGLCKGHKAQLVSYLKASELPVGLLLNFGAPSLEVRKYHRERLI